ncbi:MAG: hypothetical protein ABR863_12540 [Roseiarcus sp.]|jgi:predicted nucleotidyltransferase
MATIVDPVLSRLRAALDEVYGERIERVALYGSRARGGLTHVRHRASSR